MFGNIINFFKKFSKEEKKDSKDTAKERLHLVLMQDRANVSADFMELMKQEIIEVIKKYIDIDENAIDVKLTNKVNTDGTTGAPILYANIPIVNVKDDTKQINIERNKEEKEEKENDNKEDKKEEIEEKNKETENIEQDEEKNNENIEETENIENSDVEEVKIEENNETKQEENNEEKRLNSLKIK